MRHLSCLLFIIFLSCNSTNKNELNNLEIKTNEFITNNIKENEVLIETYDVISTSKIDSLRVNDFIEVLSDQYNNSKVKFENEEKWKSFKNYYDSIKILIDKNLENNFFGYKRTHRYRIKRQPRSINYEPPISLIVERVFFFNPKCDTLGLWYDKKIQF